MQPPNSTSNELGFGFISLIVSHNRNEIELIWNGIRENVNILEELLIDRRSQIATQIHDMQRKLDGTGSLNAEGVVLNTPLVKLLQTSHCSGETWKGKPCI